MSIEVKSIDVNQVKEELKKCPKIVRDYVRSMESVLDLNRDNLNKAIKKLRELKQESDSQTRNNKLNNAQEFLEKYRTDNRLSMIYTKDMLGREIASIMEAYKNQYESNN
jgi:hypothetical protein